MASARSGPAVFCRSQLKYGLDDHYLSRWVDRPLLLDPGLHTANREFAMSFPSYRRMLETVASYGLDGFAFFPETAGRMGAFLYTDQAAVGGVSLLPEFIPDTNLEAKRKVLRAAMDCRSCFRLDGKLLITSYRADTLPPERWAELLTSLRKELGDVFVFLPDISRPCGEGWAAWIDRFDSDQGVSEADRTRLRKYLRTYAEACDGLYMASAAAIKTHRRFHDRFYREFLVPTFREALAAPTMSGKLLGMSSCLAHINCTRLGFTLSDDGTRTLRRSFEAALSADPDVIIIPEWDEQNENTSLRPTVDNGFSSRRIMRYYMQRIRGQRLSPSPEDNLELPNLVLSYRKILTLGEQLRLELLNVPDSEGAAPYTVQLELCDIHGKTVHRFEERVFDRGQLTEVTETLPSEQLAAHAGLLPCLVVREKGRATPIAEGWRPIQLRTTWNWDYKWVKQPLRDLAPVRECQIALTPSTDWPGAFQAKGKAICNEDLASVELIENGAVVYAVDPRPSALRELGNCVLIAIDYRAMKRRGISGRIRVVDGQCIWPPSYQTPSYSWQLKGSDLQLIRYVDFRPRTAVLAVPETDIATAKLEVSIGDFSRTIAVREILAKRIVGWHDGSDMTVTVSRFTGQKEHPPHLNACEATWDTLVHPDVCDSLFHVRLVTKTGRIFRSQPILPALPAQATTVQLPVWSDSRNAAVKVRVQPARVPDITYRFDSGHGTVLTTDAGRPFLGILGGFTDSVTGRGAGGGNDGSPFIRASQYPKDASCTAPAWCTEDGRPCLRFNGNGTFIAFL